MPSITPFPHSQRVLRRVDDSAPACGGEKTPDPFRQWLDPTHLRAIMDERPEPFELLRQRIAREAEARRALDRDLQLIGIGLLAGYLFAIAARFAELLS